MADQDAEHSLPTRLTGVLGSLGSSHFGSFHHFDHGTLFWSLTRLFGDYYRVVSVLELPRQKRPFLDADLEGFIIRLRIIQNDIAYIVWQLMPSNQRGLKGPKGA